MLEASNYWQPDNKSRWGSCLPNSGTLSGSVGLGKAQLYNVRGSVDDTVHYDSVLGLSITANARIDNRGWLLKALGWESSETEPSLTCSQLILRCYARWGSQCVEHLRGDFVFVIWDEPRQRFFCARDHFGVKLLLFSHTAQGLMLSNEHNAFYHTGWCDRRQIDETWLLHNLWGVLPSPFESPHPDIQVIPPAHTLVFNAQGLKIERYWQLEVKSQWEHFSHEQYLAELKRRFERAVVARLDTDYPLGAELSEGLDSNTVLGFAVKHHKPEPIHTLSFDCVALNEENHQRWAGTYADIQPMLDMHHPNVIPLWQKGGDEASRIRMHKDALYQAFGAVIPNQGFDFIRSQLAGSQGIRVLLSGWGGDHCVSGNGSQYPDELFRAGNFRTLYHFFNARFRRRGVKPIRSWLSIIFRHGLPGVALWRKRRSRCLQGALCRRATTHFLSQSWRNKILCERNLEAFNRNYDCNSVEQKERLELLDISPGIRLVESELVGRMARLEYRFPMLDLDLVEFAHSLPSELKTYDGIERYAFRRIMEGMTPGHIQWRRKSDFVAPKLDKRKVAIGRKDELAKRLNNSILIQKYSSREALQLSLESLDPVLLSCLEFVADFEQHDYSVMPPPALDTVEGVLPGGAL